MEISDFAERVLFGASIADKLADSGDLTDRSPRRIAAPKAPGRPAELVFAPDARAPFPTLAALERDEARGRALHFFANHELLAAELMAAMLLTFPEAPPRFRIGLARTIVDEQRHLARYVARMEALGVGLGDVPVNDYFWRATIGVASPLEFVARMSLGFEQANLDFSIAYEARFSAIGDEVTAALMRDVYEDEIRHVRLGVRWFDEWRDGAATAWDAHVAALGDFNPLRLKGPVFDADGRRRAGLPADYIRTLRVLSGSRGRRPRVFVFNATAEEEVQHGVRYTPPEGAAALERDLAFVMAYLAKPEDLVLAPRPSEAFLAALLDAGFELPEIAEDATRAASPAEVVPWGESPRIDRLRADLSLDVVGAPDLFSKALTVELAERFDGEARIVRSIDEVPPGSIVKGAYGASGRNRRRVRTAADLEDASVRGWIDKALARDGFVVVEPWRERIRDFGLVLDAGGKKPLLAVYELLVDEAGRYRGHRKGDPLAGPGTLVRPRLRRSLRRGRRARQRRARPPGLPRSRRRRHVPPRRGPPVRGRRERPLHDGTRRPRPVRARGAPRGGAVAARRTGRGARRGGRPARGPDRLGRAADDRSGARVTRRERARRRLIGLSGASSATP